jgi:NTE family protein
MNKRKIGLCLSGGGARGVFHMGVLKALDEEGIRISILSGTSAGALVGSLYSAGVKPETMLSLAAGTRWFDFFKPSLPSRGLMGMDYLRFILNKYITQDDFSALEIPLKVTATNISKGILRIFDQGEVIQPVLASCSVPLLFKPILIEDEIYLDGGILTNLPASIIKEECDFLIGVSLMPLHAIGLDEVNTSFKLLTRILELSVNNNSKMQMKMCDLILESPEIATFSRFDLKGAESLYELGYKACKSKIPEIRQSAQLN